MQGINWVVPTLEMSHVVSPQAVTNKGQHTGASISLTGTQYTVHGTTQALLFAQLP